MTDHLNLIWGCQKPTKTISEGIRQIITPGEPANWYSREFHQNHAPPFMRHFSCMQAMMEYINKPAVGCRAFLTHQYI